QLALTRFVKLPPVAEEEARVRQIVEYEARQNVPFSMDEVVWDYQLIANPEGEELEVMFVVVKNEIVEQITNAVKAVGLSTQVVDVAPAAAYNAARANGIGQEACEMILDTGGHSTNLLFADKQRFFARTIPIAGNSITQQIAKEFGVNNVEAESLKRKHGFVALGGPYAEPESEVAAAVSKIVRNVMTRLHGEINRSIGVYRTQQKGNSPQKLYLSGGSSVMSFTDRFFGEKLNMEVEYFNPFKTIKLAPAIDAVALEEKAHAFAQVIGVALRHQRQMPVEINLLPQNIVRQMSMRRKVPYFAASLAAIIIVLGVGLLGAVRKENLYKDMHAEMEKDQNRLERLDTKITDYRDRLDEHRDDYQFLTSLLERRSQWVNLLSEIEQLKPQHLWLVEITPLSDDDRQDERSRDRERRRPPEREEGIFSGMGDEEEDDRSEEETEDIEVESRTVETVVVRGHSLVLGEEMEDDEKMLDEMENVDEITAEDTSGSDRTPEQKYLARLKNSDLFDNDGISITSYRSSDEIDNLKLFTIEITLAEPLEIKYN
ncbi:MAG: pilus assembly protein PilM, partial [Verrucomicrobiota bacterium]